MVSKRALSLVLPAILSLTSSLFADSVVAQRSTGEPTFDRVVQATDTTGSRETAGQGVVDAQASAGKWQLKELEDMTRQSVLVVWGHVSETESYWHSDERGRHIYTVVTIAPIRWTVGEPVEGPLALEVMGGTVGGIVEVVSNVPAFREGEEVIICLTDSPHRLLAGRRTKLDVYGGKVCWAGTELPAEVLMEMVQLIAAGLSPEPVWGEQTRGRELSIAAGPVIQSITPDRASAGTNTQVTITGDNFGDIQGDSKVEFFYKEGEPKLSAPLVSWSNRQIVCEVPVGVVNGGSASAGSGPVTVRTNAGTSNGYLFRVTFGYGQKKWPGANPIIPYYVNANTSDCTGEAAAVQRAASSWNNAGSQFTFQYAGSHEGTSPDQNFRNELMWGHTDDVVATTHTWFWEGSTEIVECDVVFNDDHYWGTNSTPGSYQRDVESVALHELGHWLQLLDLYGDVQDGEYDEDKVMYGRGGLGETKRSLHVDDVAGVKWIYPGAASQPSSVIFEDTFPSTSVDTGKWAVVQGAAVVEDNVAVNQPSRPYSLSLDPVSMSQDAFRKLSSRMRQFLFKIKL